MKSQSNSPNKNPTISSRAGTSSIADSQELTSEKLLSVFSINIRRAYEGAEGYTVDEVFDGAKIALLQLALSCLIAKHKHAFLCSVNTRGFEECDCGAKQVNAAIDTIEQRLQEAFNG